MLLLGWIAVGWIAVGLCFAWLCATGRGWRTAFAVTALWPLIWVASYLADLDREVNLYAARRRDSDGR